MKGEGTMSIMSPQRERRKLETIIYDKAYDKAESQGATIADCHRAGWIALQRWRTLNPLTKIAKLKSQTSLTAFIAFVSEVQWDLAAG
jgi:hypothetical protein